jgi:hypothetical protein
MGATSAQRRGLRGESGKPRRSKNKCQTPNARSTHTHQDTACADVGGRGVAATAVAARAARGQGARRGARGARGAAARRSTVRGRLSSL